MSRNGALTDTVRTISSRDIIVSKPTCIEPVLEAGDASAMCEWASVPNTPLSDDPYGSHAETPQPSSLISTKPKIENGVLCSMTWRGLEITGRNNFVVRIERRSVAQWTPFPLEDVLSCPSELRRRVGLGGDPSEYTYVANAYACSSV
jgi:hypothetical protein